MIMSNVTIFTDELTAKSVTWSQSWTKNAKSNPPKTSTLRYNMYFTKVGETYTTQTKQVPTDVIDYRDIAKLTVGNQLKWAVVDTKFSSTKTGLTITKPDFKSV